MKKTSSKKKTSVKKAIVKKSTAAVKKATARKATRKPKKSSSVLQKAKKVLGEVVKGALSGAATGAIDATAKAAGLPNDQEFQDKKAVKMPKKKNE